MTIHHVDSSVLTAYVGALIHNPDADSAQPWLEKQALVIHRDRIQGIVPEDQLPPQIHKRVNLAGSYLIPGFFDTQVNGGGGVLLNDQPDLAAMQTILNSHARCGTTAILPTLISDELDVIAEALQAMDRAIEAELPGIIGIHLEGPFLNPARSGVHDASKFRSLDPQALELVGQARRGRVLLTLAPEKNSEAAIRQLAQAGVVLAAGHSAATYEEARRGLEAGITSFTHLFNAMSPLTSREPGCVGAALEDRNSWCGVIVDGFHVHHAALKIALQAKPRGKICLVTDAMPSVEASDKAFWLNGEQIRAVNGRCATAAGTLAGSDLDMLTAVRNSLDYLGVDLAEAVRMASLYPAEMMGVADDIGSLAAGKRASFVALSQRLTIEGVWINGIKQVFA